MIENHPIPPGPAGREQWLSWRSQDVTASVVGALLTDHPYTTALHLWAEKRGVEFSERPENKRMRRGRELEGLVGKEVALARPQWKIEPVNCYYRDPDIRLGATPDFWLLGDPRGRGVLQAKTADASIIANRWDGGRVAPEWIQWQLRTEMLLTDAAFGVISVLEPNSWDCHIIELNRNPEDELLLVTMVKKFWLAVEQGTEPEPDFSRDADVIRAMLPRETPGKTLDLSGHNAIREMLETRAALCDSIRDMESRREAIETEVRFVIGDAERISGLNGWQITYRVEPRQGYTVPPKQPRILRIHDKRAKQQSGVGP
jgi:predicted phage-related endonuclease